MGARDIASAFSLESPADLVYLTPPWSEADSLLADGPDPSPIEQEDWYTYELGIDPGLNHIGLAWLRVETGQLVAAKLVTVVHSDETPKAVSANLAIPPSVARYCARVWVEMAGIHPAGRQRGSQEPIEDLIWLCGALCEKLGGRRAPVRHRKSTEERSWCGSVKKEVRQARLLEDLTDPEIQLLASASASVPEGLRHNLLDAVAIAKWGWRTYRDA